MARFAAIAGFWEERGVSPWRASLCLVLGVMFLYNPFCAFCMAAGPSAIVQHHVSYRSTVASCELDCGTVRHAGAHVVPLEVLVTAQKGGLQQKNDSGPKPADEIVRTVTQDFATSLWFRPPPVL